MGSNSPKRLRYAGIKNAWNIMTVYERFEQGIALILTGLIAIVIVVATLELAKEVLQLLVINKMKPLDHRLFQTLFGQVMTVLIALEFKHSILKVVARKESIIQVKTILLIGLLAVSRKFIVLDLDDFDAEMMLALAASVVGLAVAYWLVKERELASTAAPANKE